MSKEVKMKNETEIIRPEDGKPVNCVKCRELYNSAMPALSRDDNKTDVCPNCGVREAGIAVINDFNKESLRIIKKENPELFVMEVPGIEYDPVMVATNAYEMLEKLEDEFINYNAPQLIIKRFNPDAKEYEKYHEILKQHESEVEMHDMIFNRLTGNMFLKHK